MQPASAGCILPDCRGAGEADSTAEATSNVTAVIFMVVGFLVAE